MNPKGDDAWRRSLLAKKIFTSLTLLQILSNSGLAFACFSFKSCPEGISFLAGFLLCPGLKEKSLIREQKKDCRKAAFLRVSVFDQKGISTDGVSLETFFEVLRFFLGVSVGFTGSLTSDSSRRFT